MSERSISAGKRAKGVEALKQVALDRNLSHEERLDAQALILGTAMTDRDSAFNALSELAHKAPLPSERTNAQGYLANIIALDATDSEKINR